MWLPWRLKRNSTPRQRHWIDELNWYLFWYITISQSAKSHKATIYLQPPTYIHTDGIADPLADWAMIWNRPGIIKKGKPLPITCNRIKFTFPRLIWFCWAAIFLYFHQVLLVVWWLETHDTSGYVYALEKVSYQLISPTYLIRGLSSALTGDRFFFSYNIILRD